MTSSATSTPDPSPGAAAPNQGTTSPRKASSEEREVALEMLRARLMVSCSQGAETATRECLAQALQWELRPGHGAVNQAIHAQARGLDPEGTCLRLLIEAGFSDPRGNALAAAAINGSVVATKLLLPLGRARAQDSLAARAAASGGKLDVLKLLLPSSDPSAKDWEGLREAARAGHADCVAALLEAAGPQGPAGAVIDAALANAAWAAKPDVCQLLAPLASEQGLDRASRAAAGSIRALLELDQHLQGAATLALKAFNPAVQPAPGLREACLSAIEQAMLSPCVAQDAASRGATPRI